MGLLQSLGFNQSISGTYSMELPNTFPFSVLESNFIDNDLRAIYSRILTDALTRTHGLPKDQESLLWDNCLGSESQDGLVTLVAKAMVAKSDLGLIYDKGLLLIRKATSEETSEMKEAYKTGAEYKGGIYVTFKNYNRTDMLKIYSALEYYTLTSLHKSMNLSKAIQYKINNLRASTALADKAAAEEQATKIAKALREGKDVYMDAEDMIETSKPDLTATIASMDFISQKRSFYLELPASYITGLAPKGLGDTGEGDAKAVDRGLKGYYYSIIKPIVEALFGKTTSFKGEDFYGISTAGEMLKTFNVTDDELFSSENKRKIVNRLFGLPENEKGDAPAAPTPEVTTNGLPPRTTAPQV